MGRPRRYQIVRVLMTFLATIRTTATATTAPTASPSFPGVLLSGGQTLSGNGNTVVVRLLPADLVRLQQLETAGTERCDFFLDAAVGMVADQAGNDNLAVVSSQVVGFTQDATAASITSFGLDMDAGVVSLLFSEAMNISAITVFGNMRLQSRLVGSTAVVVDLNGEQADTTRTDAPVVTVQLLEADLDALKLERLLAVSSSTTFLSANATLITDQHGVFMNTIPFESGQSLTAIDFVPDTTPPQFMSFAVDMNARFIQLSFNEPIQGNSLQNLSLTAKPSLATAGLVLESALTHSTTDSRLLRLNLTVADTVALNRVADFFSSSASSILSVATGAVIDMIGNPVVPGSQVATTFVADTTSPTLLAFDITLDIGGSVTLSFDEVMAAQSVAGSSIVLQSTAVSDAIHTHRLTVGASAQVANDTLVTLDFSKADADVIKQLEFCTSASNCFIAIDTVPVDVAGNPVTVVPVTTALGVSVLTADVRQPVLVAVSEVNVNSGHLTLTFDEPVRPSTINGSALVLRASDPALGFGDTRVRLTGGFSANPTLATVVMNFTRADLNVIKLTTDVCRTVTGSNCFVTLDETFISDVFGNGVASQASVPHAVVVILDTTPPVVEAFELDLTQETMTVSFDEPIRAAAVATSGFTLQGTANLTQTPGSNTQVSASNGLVTALQPTIVTFSIPATTVAALQANLAVATTLNDTFLTLAATTVFDVSGSVGNANSAVSSDAAIPASGYQADLNNPTVSEAHNTNNNDVGFFLVNMATGVLQLSFSEPVLDSTLNISRTTFQSAATGGQTYVPVHSAAVAYIDAATKTLLQVTLDSRDLEAVQNILTLFTDRGTSFIVPGNDSVFDTAGNGLRPSATAAFQSAQYTAQARANIVRFNLDMSTGILLITFDSSVNPATLVTELVVLQSTVSSASAGVASFPLSANGSASSSTPGLTLLIQIGEVDLNAIKQDTRLAVSNATTFLSIVPDALQDLYAVPIVGEVSSNAQPVATYVADTVEPEVRAFGLDLDLGQLNFQLSEVVSPTSVNELLFTLQNGANSTASFPFEDFTLTVGSTTAFSVVHNVFTITLSEADINAIKGLRNLGTSTANTFLAVQPAAFVDTAGNNNTEIVASAALQATNVSVDAIAPEMLGFSLDMDAGWLMLSFSEAVFEETVNPLIITMSSSASEVSGSARSYTLTANGGLLTTPTANLVRFSLTLDDLNNIKALEHLATNTASTFVQLFSAGVVLDGAGNPCRTRFPGVPASTFVPDSTAPQLVSFDVDMNNGTVTLSFSETISTLLIAVPELTVHAGVGLATHRLRVSSTVTTLISSPVVVLALSTADLNAIKVLPTLLRAAATSFLSITASAAVDMVNIPVVAINTAVLLPATGYVADVTSPNVVQFSLNLNTLQLEIGFDEPVLASSITVNQFALRSSAAGGSAVPLASTTSASVSTDGLQLVLDLVRSDVDAINAFENLGTSTANTFLTATSGAITDVAAVPLSPLVAGTTALQAATFVNDTISPELVAFDINMTSGVLLLVFDEVVDVSTFSGNDVSLMLARSASSSERLILSTSIAIDPASPDDRSVTVLLDLNLLNELKRLRIAESAATTFLTHTANLIQDQHGRLASPRLTTLTALAVRTFVADTTPPTLTSFDLVMTSGPDREPTATMIMTFSETVRASSLSAAAAVLQSSSNVEKICPCQQCLDNEFFVAVCTATVDTTCQACSVCDIGSYQTQPCTSTVDTTCAACEGCNSGAGEYLDIFCNGTAPTVCGSCAVAGCVSCNGPDNTCDECATGSVLTVGANPLSNICTTVCPAGSYNNSGVCHQCHATCETCTGPSTTDCATCPTNLVLFGATQTCQSTCFNNPNNGVGVGEYQVAGVPGCIRCDSTCGDCFNSTGDTCITCVAPRFLVGRRGCQLTCPVGQTADSNRVCTACPADCSACSSTAVCTACTNPIFVLENGRCLSNTPAAATAALLALNNATQVTYSAGSSTRGNTTCTQTTTEAFEFTTSTTTTFADGPVLNVTISNANLNLIKGLLSLAIAGQASSFLAIAPTFVTDMHLNPITELSHIPVCPSPCFSPNGVPCVCPILNLAAATYAQDTTGPVLVRVTADFNVGTNGIALTLSFSETINMTSINFASFAIESGTGPTRAIGTTPTQFSIVDLTSFHILLDEDDTNFIKGSQTIGAVGPLGTFRETVQLTFNATFLNDNDANGVAFETAYAADVLVSDVTPPSLDAFSFDLNSGVLVFSFSEVVVVGSFDPTTITLQSRPNASVAEQVHLTAGVLTETATDKVYELRLTLADLNAVKRNQAVAIGDASSVWMSFGNRLVHDTQRTNASTMWALGVPSTSAINAAVFGADTTPPDLAGATLDLRSNGGLLTLSFTETVNVSSVVTNSVVLFSNNFGTGSPFRVGADASAADGTVRGESHSDVVVINLAVSVDLNAIKALSDLAISLQSSFIAMDGLGITDTAGNPSGVQGIRQIDAFFADDTNCDLVSFHLNMDRRTLHLTFSETVNTTALNTAQVRVQSTTHTASAISVPLTGGSLGARHLSVPFTHLVDLVFNDADYNDLTRQLGIAVNISTSFLAVGSTTIADMNGRNLNPISDTAALQASNFTADSSRPSLVRNTLNMTSATLTLSFSETMRAASLDVTQITIANGAVGLPGRTFLKLFDATVSVVDSAELILSLSLREMNLLKLDTFLATGSTNTFVELETGTTAEDMNANLAFSHTGLQADIYTRDSTPPTLVSYNLLMRSGAPPVTLQLSFSETVNVNLNLSAMTLRAAALSPPNSVALTVGVVSRDAIDPAVVEVELSAVDFTSLRTARPPVGDVANNTLLDVVAAAVTDRDGNELVAVLQLAVTTHTVDITQPQLVAFAIDFSSSQLLLTYSESINVTTFDVTTVTIQREAIRGAQSVTLTDSAGNPTQPRPNEIAFAMTSTDLNSIRRQGGLALDAPSTFLSLSTGSVLDFAFNFAIDVPATSALPVATYAVDSTAPTLLSYSLNLTTGIMGLTFDEVINSSSVLLSAITLQSDGASTALSVIGVDGVVELIDDLVISATLTVDSANRVRAQFPLASSDATTYLSFTLLLCSDLAGVPVRAVASTAALQIQSANFRGDLAPPVLTGFDLNMSDGVMLFAYDQPIDTLTLNTSAFSFAGTFVTGGVVGTSVRYTTDVAVTLTALDLNLFKTLGICLQSTDCLVEVAELSAQDPPGNRVTSVAFPGISVRTHIGDTVRPELAVRGFEYFNLNTGELRIRFSESVNFATLVSSRLHFVNHFDIPVVDINMTGSTVTNSQNVTVVNATLSSAVLNALKLQRQICNTATSCFLRADAGAIADTTSNPLVASSTLDSIFWGAVSFAQEFVPDTGHPDLQAFSFDVDAEVLTLTFDEAVDVSTLNVSGFVFQGVATASALSVRLSSGEAASLSGPVVSLPIGTTDMNAIKVLGICTNANDCFISADATAITDLAVTPNPIIPIPSVTALPLTGVYTPDGRPPELVQFSLDLDSEVLVLVFNEPIVTASVNITALSLQSTSNSGGLTIALTLGSISTTDPRSVSVTIALSESDATALKGNSAIATSVTNTFLSMQQGAVVDAAGLPSPVITPVAARQASALSVDITAAILQNFTLNALNRQLILTFDEIMNPASLQSTGLQLQTHQFEADSTVVYRLTSSTVAGLLTNGTVVTIQLSEQDFAAISQVEGFARSIQTSYLRMAAFTIDDIFGRDVVAITDGKSILPNVYVPDNDPPQIIRVLLNMSTGLLALSFNEPINQTTFNVEDITIASHSNSSSAGYQLRRLVANGTAETTCLQCITTATFDHDPLKKSVILLLNDVDLDAIKVAESLAVSQNSTHVFHSAALVSDFYGNQAAPVLQSSALEANSFYHDFVRPQLVQFGLNMDSGRIFLQFSEAMKSASVNIDQFSLHRDTNATNTDTSTP